MSWFNTSLNSIKGQITTFAQEVLAENPNAEEELNVTEVLEEAHRKNEELSSLCAVKESEIASLRKQISELLAKNSDGNGRSSKSPSAIEKNASLEDSWCWEPDNIPSEASAKHDHEQNSESSSGGGELIAIPLDSHSSHDSEIIEKYQRFLDERDARLKQLTSENASLYEKISKLKDENVELQSNLEELDNQHNVAMKEVLDLKNDWQTKWNLLNNQQKVLTQEHDSKVNAFQKDNEVLQKKFETIQSAYAMYVQENEVLKLEMEKAKGDIAMLETEKAINAELIASNKNLEDKVAELANQLESKEEKVAELMKLLESKETESAPQMTQDPSKKCKDEDDFIVLQNEDLSSNNYEQKYNSLLAEKEDKQQKLKALQDELLTTKTEKDTLKESLEKNILALTSEIENLKQNQSTCNNVVDISESEAKISALTEKLQQHEAISAEIEAKLKQENLNLQKQIIDLESSINMINAKTSDHSEKIVNFDDLNQVILSYTKIETPNVVDKSSLETVFKTISDKIWKVDLLEKNLKEMADEVLRLKNEKAAIDHQKTTLQADIEHYEVECAELMKNNEILLNELENYKRNKLETIPENNEESMEMMEKQLEESNSYLRNLEDQYNETVEKLIQADEKRYELEDVIEHLQESNATLTSDMKQLKEQLEALENERSNLIFEINEMKTDDKKSAVEMEIQEYKSKFEKLQIEYDQLNKDHSELQSRVNVTSDQNSSSPPISNLEYKIETLTSEKSALQNELQVLQSHIEHVQLKCSHLEEDNESLRKEIEEIQTNQSTEPCLEDVDKLRKQLEEAQSGAKCIEDRFNEISQKTAEVEIQNNELRSELAAQRDNNANLMSELVTLKAQIETLEADKNKLVFEINERRTDDNKSEAVMKTKLLEYESNIISLEAQLDSLSKDHADLVASIQSQKLNFSENRKKSEDKIVSLENTLKDKDLELENLKGELSSKRQQLDQQQQDITTLHEKLQDHQKEISSTSESSLTELSHLKQQFETLSQEKADLISTLQTKHNENTQYYMEIQRLSQLLQIEIEKSKAASAADCEHCRHLQATIDQNAASYKDEREKLQDQINFLKEKSDILTTNLMSEQSNQRLLVHEKAELTEKNAVLQRDLERLRQHLVEMEEAHTNETLELQNSIDDTKAKMLALQQEVSNSSNAYTSASIRASQHAETLQAQYMLVCQQRDEYAAKLSAAEDKESRNQAALVNLQCALEQFQKEKNADIQTATIRLRNELQAECERQNELHNEIKSLQNKLTEANQGLLAAARLSDQLEISQVTIAALKEDIVKQQDKVSALEEKLKKTQENQADKVEKNLVKSLLIGYIVSTNQNDKNQILKLITTVLDFTANETDRVGLNKTQSGWLTNILHGGGGQTGGDHNKDSLVQAFVNFLEKESQPPPSTANLPNLLQLSQDSRNTPGTSIGIQSARKLSQQSNSSTSGVQPILLNESILEQLSPPRNSSSILKDILSDS